MKLLLYSLITQLYLFPLSLAQGGGHIQRHDYERHYGAWTTSIHFVYMPYVYYVHAYTTWTHFSFYVQMSRFPTSLTMIHFPHFTMTHSIARLCFKTR